MAGDSLLRAVAAGVAAAVVILLAATLVFVLAGPTTGGPAVESAQGSLPAPQPVLPPTPLKSRIAPLPEPEPPQDSTPAEPADDVASEAQAPSATGSPPADPPAPAEPAPSATADDGTEAPTGTEAPPSALATQSPRLKPPPPPEPSAATETEEPSPPVQQASVEAKAPTVIRPGASETFGRDVRLHLEPGVAAAMCDGGYYELQWRMASLGDPGRSRKSEALDSLPRRLRCRSNRASQAELPAGFFGAGAFELRARHSWPENRDRAAGQGTWTRWRGFQVLPP